MFNFISAGWRARWAERRQAGPGFTSLLFGVILPVATIGYELVTQACASIFFDPLPTLLHVLLVALVPVFNLLLWSSLTHANPRRRYLAFANGVAIAIAAVYSFLFLPVLPLAALGVMFFGLGLLPWSPVFALIAALTLRGHLKRQTTEQQRHGATWPGVLCGVIAIVAVDLPSSLTELGMKMAIAPSTSEQTRGIRLLRTIGNEDLMLRLCYVRTGRATDLLSVITGMSSLTPLQARAVYYRVTGEPFNAKPTPSKLHRRGWLMRDFNDDLGTVGVGGQLSGLSLASSRLDGSLDANAALGYLEWTLVMKNDTPMMQEARSLVALPPGAVVSRLTLWVNGEEREAAFAARGKVTAAYRSVVEKRRDPVLVTTAGADRISVQMFPVPPRGEMKVRIGMTLPLELDHLRQASLQLPYFHDRNFDVAEDFRHSAWFESKSPLSSGRRESQRTPAGAYSLQLQLADHQLTSMGSTIVVPRRRIDSAWSHDKPAGASFIEQTLQLVPAFQPARLAVVVDSSASMASSAELISEALSRLPSQLELFVIVADDEIPARSLEPMTALDAAALIRGYEFIGGKDNTAALENALDAVLASESSALVWIHGPQPVTLRATAAIEQRLERRGQVRWYDVQVAPGPNHVLESLDGMGSIQALSLAKLSSLFERWRSGGNQVLAHREKVSRAPPPGRMEEQTSDHLARLWANDEVQRLLYTERASRESIVELAHNYQLVTPVTGAVVLETQQQYDESGLTPVPEGTVPSIPEPEEWALIVIALIVLLYASSRRQAHQHATV